MSFPSFLLNKFANFPHDCCGVSSALLAIHLKETLGCEPSVAVNRSRKGRSHAWIEVDSIIVDITADQFNEGLDPVLVTKDHIWHGKFEGTMFEEADLSNHHPDLSIAYGKIRAFLDESK